MHMGQPPFMTRCLENCILRRDGNKVATIMLDDVISKVWDTDIFYFMYITIIGCEHKLLRMH